MAKQVNATDVAKMDSTDAMIAITAGSVNNDKELNALLENVDAEQFIQEDSEFFQWQQGVITHWRFDAQPFCDVSDYNDREKIITEGAVTGINIAEGCPYVIGDAVILSTMKKIRSNGDLPCILRITYTEEKKGDNGKYKKFSILRLPIKPKKDS